MLPDSFVVIAQIINFLILVALLKRFLYKPITQVMEARSQKIERQLAAAELMEKNAHLEKELYQQKQQDLEAQKQVWLEQTQQEVAREKEKLIQQAQAEVKLAKSQWYETFERDRSNYCQETRDRIKQQVSLTTRKALRDLANTNLEAQIIETFIHRLYNLDKFQVKTISNPSRTLTIYSSFVISDQQCDRLVAAIREQIATNAEVKFATREDIICGIELRTGGYKISWNLNHYLTELEMEIRSNSCF